MMEWNTFTRIDSDETLLPSLVRKGATFDLILTDPPYNLGKDFGNRSDKLSLSHFDTINRARIAACATLLTKHGSLLWFGIHKHIGRLQLMMEDAGLSYRRMNIWRYRNGFSRSARMPKAEYEPFLWYSRSSSRWHFNTDDVRVPYQSEKRVRTPVYYTTRRGQRKAWTPNAKGAMRGDVWEYPTLAGKRFARERTGHPTQKPIALITEMLKAWLPKDSKGRYAGTVLDPYAGSGTLGICCELLNSEGHRIKWLSAELEPRWVEVSKQRMAREKKDSEE